MLAIVKKFILHALPKYFTNFDPKNLEESNKQGKDYYSYSKMLELKMEGKYIGSLPIKVVSGSLQSIQISVSGKSLLNIFIGITIGSLRVDLTQLPNQGWQNKILQLIKEEQKSQIQAYCFQQLDEVLGNSIGVMYKRLLLKIINNMKVKIDQIELNYVNEKHPNITASFKKLYIDSNKNEDQIGNTRKPGAPKRTIQIEEFSISLNGKTPMLLFSKVVADHQSENKNDSEINIALTLPSLKMKATFDEIRQISCFVRNIQEFLRELKEGREEHHLKRVKQTYFQAKTAQTVNKNNEIIRQMNGEKQKGIEKEQLKRKITKFIKEFCQKRQKKDQSNENHQILLSLEDAQTDQFKEIVKHHFQYVIGPKRLYSLWVGMVINIEQTNQLIQDCKKLSLPQNRPLFTISARIDSIQAVIANSIQSNQEIRITTSAEFYFSKFADKTIKELKYRQKSPHSSFSFKLKKDLHFFLITTSQQNKKVVQRRFFSIKSIDVGQQRFYRNEKEVYTLEKEVKIKVAGLQLDGRIKDITYLNKILRPYFQEHYQKQEKQLKQKEKKKKEKTQEHKKSSQIRVAENRLKKQPLNLKQMKDQIEGYQSKSSSASQISMFTSYQKNVQNGAKNNQDKNQDKDKDKDKDKDRHKQLYLSALKRKWRDNIQPITRIHISTSHTQIILRDTNTNLLLQLMVHEDQIIIHENFANSFVYITPKMSLYFYNSQSGDIEPIIEPFYSTVQYHSFKFGRLTQSSLKIAVGQRNKEYSELKINVSPKLLIALQKIQKELHYFENSHILIVENLTSQQIIFDEKIVSHNQVCQINIQNKTQITYMKSSKEECQLNLDDPRSFKYSNYSIELDSTKQTRVVRFLAPYILRNQSKRPIKIHYLPKQKSSGQITQQIQGGKYFPLDYIESFSLGIYKSESFSEKINAINLAQASNIVSSKKNWKVLVHPEKKQNTVIINILPPFVIHNCLPKNIHIQYNLDNKLQSFKQLKAQDSRFVFSNKFDQNLELKVRVPGYKWSESLKYSNENDNRELEFEVHDAQKNGIVLNYNFKKDKITKQYVLAIYCKKYIQFHKNLTLVFEGSLQAGQREIKNSEKFKLLGGQQIQSDKKQNKIVLIGSQIGNRIKITHTKQTKNQIINNLKKYLTSFQTSIFIGGVGLSEYKIYVGRREVGSKFVDQFKLLELGITTGKMIEGCDILSKKIVIRQKNIKINNETNKKFTIREERSQSIQIQPQSGKFFSFSELNPYNKFYIDIHQIKGAVFYLPIQGITTYSKEDKQKKEMYQVTIAVVSNGQERQYKITDRIFSTQQKNQEIQKVQSKINFLLKIPSITISLIHNSRSTGLPYESMVLSITKFRLYTSQSEKQKIYEFKFKSLQLDQMYPQNVSNPVILKSVGAKNFLTAIVNISKEEENTINQVSININDVEVNLTVDSLNAIIATRNQFGSVQQGNLSLKNKDESNQNKNVNEGKKLISVKLIKIAPFIVYLSAQANIKRINRQNNEILATLMSSVGAINYNSNKVPIKICGIKLEQCKNKDSNQIIIQILYHYQNNCANQFYKQFRGFEIQGRRANNLQAIAGRYKDVQDKVELEFEKEYPQLDQIAQNNNPQSKGVFDFIAKNTDKISDGLAFLTFDKNFEDYRDKESNKRPKDTLQGLQKGGKALFHGIKQGITGVFKQPYLGAREEGALGFIKGTGKGLAGLVIKPITGCCDFISGTAQGIKNSSDEIYVQQNLKTARYPRVFYTSQSVMKQYSWKVSKLYYIIKKEHKQKKLTTPILINAYEYSNNQFLALLQHSVAFVRLNSQTILQEFDYSQLYVKEDVQNQTLTFRKGKEDDCYQCGNQYKLRIPQKSTRKEVLNIIRQQQNKRR